MLTDRLKFNKDFALADALRLAEGDAFLQVAPRKEHRLLRGIVVV